MAFIFAQYFEIVEMQNIGTLWQSARDVLKY